MPDVGTFFESLTLIGANGQTATMRGMVDTGAHFTVVPASVLDRLAVRPIDRIPVRFADGGVQEWQFGQVEAS